MRDRAQQATAAEPQAAAQSPYNERVLEITESVADRLVMALDAEAARIAEFTAWADTQKTPEEYEQCRQSALMSGEGQALGAEYVAAMDNIKTTEDMAKAAEEYTKKYEDLVLRLCGTNPSMIQARADTVRAAALEEAIDVSDLEPVQYQIIIERVPPACGGALPEGDDGLKVPGAGTDMFYVYSATEVAVLRKRCPTLMAKINARL